MTATDTRAQFNHEPNAGGGLASSLVSRPWFLACIMAIAALAPASLPIIGERYFVAIAFTLTVAVWAWGTDRVVLVAVALMGSVAMIRRITGGADAYVLNDPFAVVPIALLACGCLGVLRSRLILKRMYLYLTLLGWLVLSGVVGVLSGSGTAALYGTIAAVCPMVVGYLVISGRFPYLFGRLITLLGAVAIFAAFYAIAQRFAPFSWDLNWLRGQQDVITSVGRPEIGKFRVWGPAESPGSLATFLGLGLIALVVGTSKQRAWARWSTVISPLACVPLFLALAFTSVRTVLFALPLAVAMGLAASGRGAWKQALGFGLLAVCAALVLPLLSPDTSGTNLGATDTRYNLFELQNDDSFQARDALLEEFSSAGTLSPFGTGPGSSGIAARLNSGERKANLDNGFLVRLVETGVIGLTLYVSVIAYALIVLFRRCMRRANNVEDGICVSIILYFLTLDISAGTSMTSISVVLWVAVAWALRASPSEGGRGRLAADFDTSRYDRGDRIRYGRSAQ